jgi:hypothetical protein
VEGCVFDLFEAVVKDCFSVFFMVIRNRIFERHSIVFFPHSDIQLENGQE